MAQRKLDHFTNFPFLSLFLSMSDEEFSQICWIYVIYVQSHGNEKREKRDVGGSVIEHASAQKMSVFLELTEPESQPSLVFH